MAQFGREEKWVAVTGDREIRYNPLEQKALNNAGVRTFLLGSF